MCGPFSSFDYLLFYAIFGVSFSFLFDFLQCQWDFSWKLLFISFPTVSHIPMPFLWPLFRFFLTSRQFCQIFKALPPPASPEWKNTGTIWDSYVEWEKESSALYQSLFAFLSPSMQNYELALAGMWRTITKICQCALAICATCVMA